MVDQTDYTYLAQRFNQNVGSDEELSGFSAEADAQFDVACEEMEELIEAYYKNDIEGVAEEMADVLVTVFVLADRMNIDVSQAYNDKMMYNLSKTGERDENGKVTDDTTMEKPDFGRFVDGSDN